MLPSRVALYETTSSQEDIFASALTTIFPDDTVNSHGTPGSYVTYKSPLFGDIKLQIPQYPDEEQGRKLFAHHLWNAGVVVADAVEYADGSVRTQGGELIGSPGRGCGAHDDGEGKVVWDPRWWDVRGRTVLELGAGTALPSIISILVSAKSVTITDHPSSPALTTNSIEQNLTANLKARDATSSGPPRQSDTPTSSPCTSVAVYGYVWGTETFYLPRSYGKPASIPPPASFDRIVIADCLWMPSQHINLIKTILTFLSPAPSIPSPRDAKDARSSTPTQQSPPCALVVAGFHTGRAIVANFFSLATEPPNTEVVRPVDPPWKPHSPEAPSSTDDSAAPEYEGELSASESQHVGQLKLATIFEVDVDLNTRPWSAAREGGTKWDAKRWCVVGVLVRR